MTAHFKSFECARRLRSRIDGRVVKRTTKGERQSTRLLRKVKRLADSSVGRPIAPKKTKRNAKQTKATLENHKSSRKKDQPNKPKTAGKKKRVERRSFIPIDRCLLRCARRHLEDEDLEMLCKCSSLYDDHPCSSASKCENRAMYIECHRCTNGERCHNRRFQEKQYAAIEVRSAGAKGFGVFAKKDIQKGSLIIEFLGEIIDHAAFKTRCEAAAALNRGRHLYVMSLEDGRAYIDATNRGNEGRFINHSCEPNAITEKWTIKDREVQGNGGRIIKVTSKSIGFFALRTIRAGEEIVYDYLLKAFGGYNQKCLCKAPKCRGMISINSGDRHWNNQPKSIEQMEEKEKGVENDKRKEDEKEAMPPVLSTRNQRLPLVKKTPAKQRLSGFSASDSPKKSPLAALPMLQFVADENKTGVIRRRISKRSKHQPAPPAAFDSCGGESEENE